MPTACYDYDCHGECEGPQNCYVLRDSYGNNAGYASVVERMLSEIEAAGGSVTFGATLVAVKAQGQGATAESGERAEAAAGGTPVVGSPTSLLFQEWPTSVGASRVILNLPANAIEGLDPSSVIFHDSPPQTVVALKNVTVFAMVKAYAWYDDAWWASKLGRMQGQFEAPGGSEAVMQRQFIVAQKTSEASTKPSAHGRLATPREPPPAPLLGRYHDGPLQCVVGADSAGLPVYSGDKVRFGNCSGALEVYYGEAHPYFVKLMTSPLEPLTVMTAEDGDAASRTALAQVHAALMRYHASALQAAGLDQPDPPRALVVANWVADGAFTPGIGSFGAPPHRRGVPVTPDPPGTDALRRDIRKPSAEHDVFIVNQDYGYESGWAAGSLIMAEKVKRGGGGCHGCQGNARAGPRHAAGQSAPASVQPSTAERRLAPFSSFLIVARFVAAAKRAKPRLSVRGQASPHTHPSPHSPPSPFVLPGVAAPGPAVPHLAQRLMVPDTRRRPRLKTTHDDGRVEQKADHRPRLNQRRAGARRPRAAFYRRLTTASASLASLNAGAWLKGHGILYLLLHAHRLWYCTLFLLSHVPLCEPRLQKPWRVRSRPFCSCLAEALGGPVAVAVSVSSRFSAFRPGRALLTTLVSPPLYILLNVRTAPPSNPAAPVTRSPSASRAIIEPCGACHRPCSRHAVQAT